MAVTVINPTPVQTPAPSSVSPSEGGVSAELGEHLSRLHTEQVKYDLQRVEELAHLRSLQDRD